jgi:hypothetical protein
MSSSFMGGMGLGGYYCFGEAFQLGGFFLYEVGRGELNAFGSEYKADLSLLGGGISLKVGGLVGDRVWLGGQLDFGGGYSSFDRDDSTEEITASGLLLAPRFVVDVLAVDTGAFKLGIATSAGLLVVPWASVDLPSFFSGATGTAWVVTPALYVGVMLGG